MKVSLHFGLNQVDPARYNGWPGYLNACWNDAVRTAALLATAGYEASGVFDADCTLNRLRTELAAAAAKLTAGDTLVFSNSGHGSQSSGWAGTEEGLCLYDGILVDSEFRELLAGFAPGVNVVVILDVCHAAGMDRSLGVRSRVAPLFVTRGMVAPRKPPVKISANVIILASSARDETSADGEINGAFTGTMLDTLVETMTWREWLAACARVMSRNFPAQHPELIELGGSGLPNQRIA